MSNSAARFDVTAEFNGRKATGTYTVQGGVVTVSSSFGTRATQQGRSEAATVARWLLEELIAQADGPD